jgi:radical SAM superfamily enzyme YgiQ (UPF0313 family)
MKILFLQPDTNVVGYKHICFIEPLGFESLAACLLPQHRVKIVDMRVEPELEKAMDEFQPDIVGTTAYTSQVYEAQGILRKVKELNPDVLTVIGGVHATFAPHDFQKPFVDVIVKGEGEVTFKELVEAHEKNGSFDKIEGIIFRTGKKWIVNPLRSLIKNLDELPIPARHLTKDYHEQYYWLSWQPCFWVETSRGCPYRCSFCSVWRLNNGKYRMRSPERVVDEVESIDGDYIFFSDDNFFVNTERAREICWLLKRRKVEKKFSIQGSADIIAKNPGLIKEWVEIGLEEVAIGFESFRDTDLRRFKKRASVSVNEQALEILSKHKIRVFGQFIVDVDYSEEDFDLLAEYVEKLPIAFCQFSILTPLPGTELYEQRRKDLLTDDYKAFDVIHPVLPTRLEKWRFNERFVNLYRRTYLSPKNALKKLKTSKISPFQLYAEWKIAKMLINELERQLRVG